MIFHELWTVPSDQDLGNVRVCFAKQNESKQRAEYELVPSSIAAAALTGAPALAPANAAPYES